MGTLLGIDPQKLQAIEGEYRRAIERHRRKESDRNSSHVSEVARGLALSARRCSENSTCLWT